MKIRLLLLFYHLLAALALAGAAAMTLFSPRWRAGLRERLGGAADAAGPGAGETFWVHGASVGEILAAEGLVKGLLERRPEARVVLSTFTAAGKGTASGVYGELGERVTFTLLPLDWGGIPGRVLDRYRPLLFVILETELWPVLLYALRKRGVPLVLANGRLSTRSFPRYRALRWFFGPFLAGISRACVRGEEDGERFRRIGVPGGKIVVTGNLKHDRRTSGSGAPKTAAWKRRLADEGGGGVVVAGSLRGREGEEILEAFITLKKDFPGIRLVLAPRHPENFDSGLVGRRPLRWIRWSEAGAGGPAGGEEVILLDTLGELIDFYGVADIAFVGGTIDGSEGHNLLEPALQGVPVLFGPGFSSFEEEGRALLAAGGGFLTPDGAAVVAAADRLLGDPEYRREAGRKAREAAERFGGAVERTLDVLEAVLEEEGR
jgi:3-deoxy-D-manno-octulosonic-acid transferase